MVIHVTRKAFGAYLRKLRLDRGFSLKILSENIGITPYYLSYLENGIKSNPNKIIISKIFVHLKLSKDEMEKLLDLHAKANGIVSYDIAE